jgi:hypothetical protein
MVLRDIIKQKIGIILLRRAYRSRTTILKNKIYQMKKMGHFTRFPYNQIHPVIYKYDLLNTYSKSYIDFFYSINRVETKDFIPIPVYLFNIEPILNDYGLLKAVEDKNSYERLFVDVQFPKTLLRKIHGNYYNAEYKLINISNKYLSKILKDNRELFLKPSTTSGSGKGIVNYVLQSDGKTRPALTIQSLEKYPDFILQESIIQHDFFRKFNPTCNNTIRILTYRSVQDNRIHILHRLLRIGKSGALVDHDNQGGIAVGISEQGILNNFGTTKDGIKVISFNGIKIISEKVPYIDEIERKAITIAEQVFYGRLLAIDFTVQAKGRVLLIEVNCHSNGISQYQMNNGPLFGAYTNEILDFVTSKRKIIKPRIRFE